MAIVEAWLSDASVTLPFNRDPGTAERFTELWAKAFKEVCRCLFCPSPFQILCVPPVSTPPQP